MPPHDGFLRRDDDLRRPIEYILNSPDWILIPADYAGVLCTDRGKS